MNTTAPSLNTHLTDRVLWFDGVSAFDPSNLLQLVSKYNVTHVTCDSQTVRVYNKHVPKSQEIVVKTECGPITSDWSMPAEYKNLDVFEYLTNKHITLTSGMDPAEVYNRDLRLVQELAKYNEFGLIDVLRAIIWTINKLTSNGTVWGVGRGSSVSSYVLYVIGVHDVDSYMYDLEIDDFLHV